MNDYRCTWCGRIVEDEDETLDEVVWPCECDKNGAVFKRIWSAPHIGPGSSGEPPR